MTAPAGGCFAVAVVSVAATGVPATVVVSARSGVWAVMADSPSLSFNAC